jgi:DNA-binding NtrC family response regulator
MAKILVIDDEANDRELVEHVLKNLGHEVDTADGSKNATALLQSQTYDVILSDFDYKATGGNFLALHETLGTIKTPIILMSDIDRTHSLAAVKDKTPPVVEFVQKEINPEKMKAQLKSAIEKALAHTRDQGGRGSGR